MLHLEDEQVKPVLVHSQHTASNVYSTSYKFEHANRRPHTKTGRFSFDESETMPILLISSNWLKTARAHQNTYGLEVVADYEFTFT